MAVAVRKDNGPHQLDVRIVLREQGTRTNIFGRLTHLLENKAKSLTGDLEENIPGE